MEVGLLVYHYNHLGSTTAITDGEGKLVYSYDYGTYGELVSTTEYSNTTPIVRFLYNGQLGVATDDNELYYMRFRYYNPEIKRFINQDVLIGSIAKNASLNRYSYVEGNPVSYIDPFGLSPFSFLNVFNPSMIVHTALDILGCLPGGAIFDVANAAIYFMEDNETKAWKCVFFAIPGADLVGKGAKWGAKLGGKGGKIVEQTMKSIDFAGHLGSTYFAASDFGNGIAFMIDKYMVGEAEFSSDTVWEFASLAGHGFQLRSFSGSFLNNAKAGNYGSTLMEASTTDLSLNSMFGEGSVFNYIVNDNSGGIEFSSKVSDTDTVKMASYYEYKALKQQGYSASEAYDLMKQFRVGNNPNNEFAFHFTTLKGGQGITQSGYIKTTSSFSVAGRGVYAGTTPTPSWSLKHLPYAGWGLGKAPVRIPIKINDNWNIKYPKITPPKSMVIIPDNKVLKLNN